MDRSAIFNVNDIIVSDLILQLSIETKSNSTEANLPLGQFEHAAGPKNALYFEASHLLHMRPFGPVNPRLHVHIDSRLFPTREIELSGHSIHTALPIFS